MRFFRFFGVCALFGVFAFLVASVLRGHYINACICGLAIIFAWAWYGDVQAEVLKEAWMGGREGFLFFLWLM